MTRKRMKELFRRFVKDKPGERFRKLNASLRRTHHKTRLLLGGLGVLLILASLLLGFVPGLPGILLFPLGLALIAAPFHFFSAWLDAVEKNGRRVIRRLRSLLVPGKRPRHGAAPSS